MTALIPPLPRRTDKESVAVTAHLERLIATGAVAPGERLPAERALAEQLSVSRTTLREAMHELENRRLIERTRGRGTRVRELGDRERDLDALVAAAGRHDDVAELRFAVEPLLARLAAQRATSASIVALEELVAASGGPITAARSLELDTTFHQTLASAAGNPLLSELQRLVVDWTTPLRRDSHAHRTGRTMSARGHEAILVAVRSGDPDAAQRAMERHLVEVGEAIATERDRRAGNEAAR
ncbi:FadR/GntR family transcriptional regulator [Mycetocola reblochoni]|uniref:Transcriptional regulator, GntR family n=2 Tax=Mycetocola reblochoni TaxID=331618 RepID=A0A1R4JXN2_9MICO|nr:FCD domain-containing protein [Mycetocola reblochoni]RLP70605.1 FadR family transcriptional regulator [Mycetocola reblochoni]SJN36654.1 Transcriptional regulator, GntR family [Mycetocola reblochoni REB411]